MDFVPSSLANPSTVVGATLSGVTIVASTASGLTSIGSTLSGATLVGSTVMVGGTLSGTSLVSVTVNSGSTISVYALPTRQFVHVTKTSDQTINNNTYTKANYQTEEFDAAGVFDLSTDRMTPTVAGKYLVVASAGWNNAVVNDFLTSAIYKNGNKVAQNSQENSNNQTSSPCAVAYVDMNGTTDYLEHFVRQVNAATTDRTLYSSTDVTYFMAMWMSA